MNAEVAVVGGGPGGLSAALVLGRARRRTLVIDSGEPANRVSTSIGGLPGQEGVSPEEFRSRSRSQLEELPSLEVRNGRVESVEGEDGDFRLRLAGGGQEGAEKVLLAHGLDYGLPAIKGIEEIWGVSGFHCPFCDAWEVCGEPLAVFGDTPEAVRFALMLKGWTDDLILCTGGTADFGDGGSERIAAAGIHVREDPIAELVSSNGKLSEIRFESGDAEHRTALFFQSPVRQPNDLAEQLDCVVGEGGVIEVDLNGRTGVPGVFATGDAAAPVRSVAIAIGMGALAAKAITAELLV